MVVMTSRMAARATPWKTGRSLPKMFCILRAISFGTYCVPIPTTIVRMTGNVTRGEGKVQPETKRSSTPKALAKDEARKKTHPKHTY